MSLDNQQKEATVATKQTARFEWGQKEYSVRYNPDTKRLLVRLPNDELVQAIQVALQLAHQQAADHGFSGAAVPDQDDIHGRKIKGIPGRMQTGMHRFSPWSKPAEAFCLPAMRRRYAILGAKLSIPDQPTVLLEERDPIVKSATVRIFALLFLVMAMGIGGPAPVQAQLTNEEKLEKLCEEKNSAACFTIGERFRTLDRDNKKALPYYIKACELEYYTGCTNAGILTVLDGETYSNIPKRNEIWKQAGGYFKKACDVEESNACSNLGLLKYKEGRIGPAKKYYKKACDLGNNVACNRLEALGD